MGDRTRGEAKARGVAGGDGGAEGERREIQDGSPWTHMVIVGAGCDSQVSG